MGDCLGTVIIAPSKREFRSFKEARTYIHSLNIKNQTEWVQYCKSGNKPNDIPSNPNISYSGKGWSGYADWLGNKRWHKLKK